MNTANLNCTDRGFNKIWWGQLESGCFARKLVRPELFYQDRKCFARNKSRSQTHQIYKMIRTLRPKDVFLFFTLTPKIKLSDKQTCISCSFHSYTRRIDFHSGQNGSREQGFGRNNRNLDSWLKQWLTAWTRGPYLLTLVKGGKYRHIWAKDALLFIGHSLLLMESSALVSNSSKHVLIQCDITCVVREHLEHCKRFVRILLNSLTAMLLTDLSSYSSQSSYSSLDMQALK